MKHLSSTQSASWKKILIHDRNLKRSRNKVFSSRAKGGEEKEPSVFSSLYGQSRNGATKSLTVGGHNRGLDVCEIEQERETRFKTEFAAVFAVGFSKGKTSMLASTTFTWKFIDRTVSVLCSREIKFPVDSIPFVFILMGTNVIDWI